MKRIVILLLVAATMFVMAGCGAGTPEKVGSGEGNDNSEEKIAPKTVGETFVTDKFSLTVSDFQFVRAANFDYSYDFEDIVTSGYDGDTVTAYFRFQINNTGSDTYELFFIKPSLVAGDIVYDGSLNGVSMSHCITTDDASSTISPLENKEFNYCIFNIPTAMMDQASLELHFPIGGTTYVYTIK